MSSKTKTVRNTPADSTLPKVGIEIGGTTYHLVWDYNALATAESITGINLLQALRFDGISAQQLRGLFFAALLKLQPKITLESAGMILKDVPTGLRVLDALVEAYHGSMPEPEEPASPNAGKPESD